MIPTPYLVTYSSLFFSSDIHNKEPLNLYFLDQIPNFQSNNVPLYKTGLVPWVSLETPPESEFLILKN